MEDEAVARPFRMTVHEFEAIFEAGLIEDQRVELRDGVLVTMPPQYLPHMRAKMRLLALLMASVKRSGIEIEIGIEGSVRIEPYDEPEPDISLFVAPERHGPILSERVRLAIEICNTSRREDLGRKPGLYARAGFPEYWVADLDAKAMHVMWSPFEGCYAERKLVPFGVTLAAMTLPGIEIDTTELLDI